MDPILIIQVIINLIVLIPAQKETMSGGKLLILLISWILPIFILGLLKAVLVWVLSIVVTVLIISLKEKLVSVKWNNKPWS